MYCPSVSCHNFWQHVLGTQQWTYVMTRPMWLQYIFANVQVGSMDCLQMDRLFFYSMTIKIYSRKWWTLWRTRRVLRENFSLSGLVLVTESELGPLENWKGLWTPEGRCRLRTNQLEWGTIMWVCRQWHLLFINEFCCWLMNE